MFYITPALTWEIRDANTWDVIVTDFQPVCASEARMVQDAMKNPAFCVIEIDGD